MRIGTDGDLSRRIALEHWHAQVHDMQTSAARLASGLRINAAVDDAAGLAIAEKMRSHVLGARQAQHNAQDGISLLRVADGALAETAGLLQRMRVIAGQAANGTWSDAQRAALQVLLDASLRGIDEIARTTAYHTIHLLDGSRSGLTLQVGSTAGDSLAIDLGGSCAAEGLGLGSAAVTTTTYRTVATTAPGQTVTTTAPDQVSTTTTTTYAASGFTGRATALTGHTGDLTDGTYFVSSGSLYAGATAAGPVIGTYNDGTRTVTFASGATAVFDNTLYIKTGGLKHGEFTLTSSVSTTTTVIPGATTTTVMPGATTTTQVAETVTTPGTAVSVATAADAGAAIGRVDAAIELLQDRRAVIGAAEGSLTHAIAALAVQEINLSAAEGRIRDADVPAEVNRLARLQTAAEASAQAVSQAILAQFAAVNTLLGTLDAAPPAAPSGSGTTGPAGSAGTGGAAGGYAGASAPPRGAAHAAPAAGSAAAPLGQAWGAGGFR